MTVTELALAYAAALMEYHELEAHVTEAGANALRQDLSSLRAAMDAMVAAHTALNDACKAEALTCL